MTGRGWALLAACATLFAVGLSTGVPVYYSFAVACAALLVVAFAASLLALWTLRVAAGKPADRAVRGETSRIGVTTRHAGLLPAGSITLDVAGVGETQTLDASVMPFRSNPRVMELSCPHRGVYSVGVTAARVEDVFGLCRVRRRLGGCTFALEVAPRVRKLPAIEPEAGDVGPTSSSRSAEDASSPSGIREWRDGDELKRVHWKLTMRRRELIVRTYDETAKPDTLILADLTPIGALPTQALAIEDAICESAASAVFSQLADEYPVRMPLSCARPTEVAGRSAADMPRFLDALTSATFDCPYPFEQVLGVEMRRSQRTGAAVIITSRLTMRMADIAMQLRRGGMLVRVYWISEARGGDGAGLTARLKLSGVEVRRVNPYEEIA